MLDVTIDESQLDLAPRASVQAFIMGSSSNRTWWQCGCRLIIEQPSWAHTPISGRIPNPNRRLILSITGRRLRINVADLELLIRGALDGIGLAFVSEDRAALHLESGALVRVLGKIGARHSEASSCITRVGYCPSRRQQPAGLSALIDAVRP